MVYDGVIKGLGICPAVSVVYDGAIKGLGVCPVVSVVYDGVIKGLEPCLCDWVIEGLGMSSRVCVTG